MDNKLKKYNCIGILGGTFNPVHKGHTMLAREVIEQFPDIEQLLLMPNNLPAYKDTDHIIDSEHRINMLKLVSEDIPKTYVSDLEIIRGGTTYTIDTLRQIKSINSKVKIYFIIGADSLYSIEKWREFKEIFKLCTIIAAKRDCDLNDIKDYSKKLKEMYPYFNIEFLDTEAVDISSSKLRDKAKCGKLDVKYLDDNIVQYIKINNLYGWKD
ncbi:MAG: nicotinate-nucleotide adenylyltransferase [Lachnospiraceae bacterium]|nr:nicotinate-nucleotide adenylyltransferase [Lachnospiraceae bacterium]